MRVALLSLLMLSAIVMGGAGIYGADAAGGGAVVTDGYGISTFHH